MQKIHNILTDITGLILSLIHLFQYPKPIKGFIKSLHPPSPNIMVSFHISQLITAAKRTNVTKSELLKLVKKNLTVMFFLDNKLGMSNHVICFTLFQLHISTSAHQHIKFTTPQVWQSAVY